MPDPLISIITATYNRSNILGYSIRCVLNSTYDNWEHLIIGDACTDDTEEVVNSFNDERIRFVNLDRNFGEQSGPNNRGGELASGKYICYLNHDDLWFPDHLEQAVQAIRKSDADFVSNLVCAVNDKDEANIIGLPGKGRPEPFYWTPASGWLIPKKTIESVGPWRFYRECYAIPSQDWLFRAWKQGKKLHLNPMVTVIAIQSGKRAKAYRKREYKINEAYYKRIVEENGFREKLLTELTIRYLVGMRYIKVTSAVSRMLKNLIIRFIFRLKKNPYAFLYFIQYGKKGGFIDRLRKNRGLTKLTRRN